MSLISDRSPSKEPDFLIIGVQKGGTTSLFEYLRQHPQVAPPEAKEIHFFDLHFDRGWEWYLSHFPSSPPQLEQNTDAPTKKIITGEASPYYIFHPLVPARVKQYCPEIKLIVLLRDPITRAISHYYHCYRLQLESLPMEEAFAQEFERLQGEIDKIHADPLYHSYNHQHLSYLSRGRYQEQLAAWRAYFPPEQFLILKSEDFWHNPTPVWQRVTDFLGIDPFSLGNYYSYNQGEYPQVPNSIIQQLSEYFELYNQQLYEYLRHNFSAEIDLNFASYRQYWQLKLQNRELQQKNGHIIEENKILKTMANELENKIKILRENREQLKQENRRLTEYVQWMKSSKFWKLRNFWLKIKMKLDR